MSAADYRAPESAPAYVRAPGDGTYCPWRHLGELGGVGIEYHEGGPAGFTRFTEKRISLRAGMTAAERRSTLAHELAHIERGPCPGPADGASRRADEHLADLTAVHRLIPPFVLDRLPELVERHGREAAMDFLGIDAGMLRVGVQLSEALAS